MTLRSQENSVLITICGIQVIYPVLITCLSKMRSRKLEKWIFGGLWSLFIIFFKNTRFGCMKKGWYFLFNELMRECSLFVRCTDNTELRCASIEVTTRTLSLCWADGSWKLFCFPRGSELFSQRPNVVFSRRLKFRTELGLSARPIQSRRVAIAGTQASGAVLTLWDGEFGTLDRESRLPRCEKNCNFFQSNFVVFV